MKKGTRVLSWTLVIVVAGIYLMTVLLFKFPGAKESVDIFVALGADPWLRYLSGVMELIASGLLLNPRTRVYGALQSLMIITAAIMTHFFVIGIVFQNDGGALFVQALVVLFATVGLLCIHRRELPVIGKHFAQA